MLNFRRIAAIVFFGICLSSIAHAEESLRVPGPGATRCEDVVKISRNSSMKEDDNIELASWAQGYLSGLMTSYVTAIASFGGETKQTSITVEYDSSGHWLWLTEHCQANPSDNFAEAVMALFQETISG